MEFVLVVPRSRLFPECYPQGLVPFGGPPGQGAADREAFEDAVREHGYFVERDHAERDPTLKQIIPYTLVRVAAAASGDGAERILLVRRLKGGGEARLHRKLSIGIGGHVNPEDLDGAPRSELLSVASRRELEEELVLEGATSLRSVGILNDDSNPVGAVHVGLVQVLHLEGSVRIREEDVLEGELVDRGELLRLREQGANFETWSSLLIDSLDELLFDSVPVNT